MFEYENLYYKKNRDNNYKIFSGAVGQKKNRLHICEILGVKLCSYFKLGVNL